MIVRYCGVARAMWALLVAIQSICGESSASDRAMLGVVTPYAVGLGEDLMVHWDYDNGNGGVWLQHEICVWHEILQRLRWRVLLTRHTEQ